MRKVFIDCGGHQASSVKMFYQYYPQANEFEVHSFEANPHLHKFFKGQKTRLHKEAVWVANGEILFWIGKNPLNMSATVIDGKTTGNFRKKPILVPCIDFSKWVKSNFQKDDHIVLKMDIEGAEYPVLSRMMSDGTIDYVNELFVDWHYTKIPMAEKQHFSLLKELKEYGLVAKEWASEKQFIEGITNV